MTDNKKTTQNPHDGHRKRMRERFLHAPTSFSDHEVLEMLLYHAIPRSNTNETAHHLLDRFGSLEGVLNADVRELRRMDGVGPTAALMLTLMGETFRRIARKACKAPKSYRQTKELIAYMQHLFVGETTEKLYLLLYDNSLNLLNCVCLNEGAVNCVQVSPRTIMENVVHENASAIVLAHNHPNGIAVPSSDDIEATKNLKIALGKIQIELLEHFVFAGDRYLPILNDPYGSPAQVENSFYATYAAKHDAADEE